MLFTKTFCIMTKKESSAPAMSHSFRRREPIEMPPVFCGAAEDTTVMMSTLLNILVVGIILILVLVLVRKENSAFGHVQTETVTGVQRGGAAA